VKRIMSLCTAVWLLVSIVAVSFPSVAAAQDQSVNPPSGPAGTTFTFQVSGLDSGELVGYWLNAPNGTVLAIGDNSTHARKGRFTFSWTSHVGIPVGMWQFVVEGVSSGAQRVVPFEVTEPQGGTTVGSTSAIPPTGTVGTTFTFYATGFTGGERIGYWLNAPNGTIVSFDNVQHRADSNGAFSTTWTVPGGAALGTWQLVAQGTSSGIVQVVTFTVG
jgi:hypothetical protein